MLLFFFMVATVMRDSTLMVKNTLPAADQAADATVEPVKVTEVDNDLEELRRSIDKL